MVSTKLRVPEDVIDKRMRFCMKLHAPSRSKFLLIWLSISADINGVGNFSFKEGKRRVRLPDRQLMFALKKLKNHRAITTKKISYGEYVYKLNF